MSSSEVGILSVAAPVRGRWLERCLRTCRDLSSLTASHPMMAAVVDEVDTLVAAVAERAELQSARAAIEGAG